MFRTLEVNSESGCHLRFAATSRRTAAHLLLLCCCCFSIRISSSVHKQIIDLLLCILFGVYVSAHFASRKKGLGKKFCDLNTLPSKINWIPIVCLVYLDQSAIKINKKETKGFVKYSAIVAKLLNYTNSLQVARKSGFSREKKKLEQRRKKFRLHKFSFKWNILYLQCFNCISWSSATSRFHHTRFRHLIKKNFIKWKRLNTSQAKVIAKSFLLNIFLHSFINTIDCVNIWGVL